MSALRWRVCMADGAWVVHVCIVWNAGVGDGGNDLRAHAHAAADLVPCDLVGGDPEERRQRPRVAAGSRPWKLRDSMDVAAQDSAGHGSSRTGAAQQAHRGGRDLPRGLEEGVRGRETFKKALVVIAAQEDGNGIGRIRMRRIPDASAGCLLPFVESTVELGSVIRTDGWSGYAGLEGMGYRHEVTVLKRSKASASDLLPRVHRVASLLKRWILGTHQGAVSPEHLDGYLDEFTFRFNRRTSRSRGKLFYRLMQNAMAVEPAPYKDIIKGIRGPGRQHHNI